MKLLFGITSLNQGGAERVLVDLANELSKIHDVTILTLYANNDFESELNTNIKRINIYNKRYNELSFFKKKSISLKLVSKSLREKMYKKYINDEYDVNIAFLEGPITWLLSCGNSKKVAWIHNDINKVFSEFNTSNKKQNLNYESYLKYNHLVFVSDANMLAFKKRFSSINVNTSVITNYVDINRIKTLACEFVEFSTKNNLVQISRLVPQKNVSRLIDVHKKLIDKGIMHNIYVIGDGPKREELQNKIDNLKLNETFHLLGGMNNPYPYLKESDAFILTSDYEGYPVSIIEAKILNKFIMITDSSAREALKDYENFIITENNEDGIYNGIKSILNNKKINEVKEYDNHDIINKINDLVSGLK